MGANIIIPSKNIFSDTNSIAPNNIIKKVSFEKENLEKLQQAVSYSVYEYSVDYDNVQELKKTTNNSKSFITVSDLSAKAVYDIYNSNPVLVGNNISIGKFTSDNNDTYYAKYSVNNVNYALADNNSEYNIPGVYYTDDRNNVYGRLHVKLEAESKDSPFVEKPTIALEMKNDVWGTTRLDPLAGSTTRLEIYHDIEEAEKTYSISIKLNENSVIGSFGSVSSFETIILHRRRDYSSNADVTITGARISTGTTPSRSIVTYPQISSDYLNIDFDIYFWLMPPDATVIFTYGNNANYVIRTIQATINATSPTDTSVALRPCAGVTVLSAEATIFTKSEAITELTSEATNIFNPPTNELFNTLCVVDWDDIQYSIYDYIADAIIHDYVNGKETATLLCSISDYYDTDGNKVISTETDNKMCFENGDIVVPYVCNAEGSDVPMSVTIDGEPKGFEVVGIRKYSDGAVWQELTLLEIIKG